LGTVYRGFSVSALITVYYVGLCLLLGLSVNGEFTIPQMFESIIGVEGDNRGELRSQIG